jgi:hypothetical protein
MDSRIPMVYSDILLLDGVKVVSEVSGLERKLSVSSVPATRLYSSVIGSLNITIYRYRS